MLADMLSNPMLCLAVIVVAVLISKVLKASKKIIGGIVCIGLAYLLITKFFI